jgi:hypothetical protein
MSDGDRPLNNDWVLGPEPLDLWEAAFSWGRGMEPYRGNVRKTTCGNVRSRKPRCPFCGAPTKWIRDKLFCRDCGYFESCCDGGKEAVPAGEC